MGSKSYSKGISWFDDCRIPFVDENIDLELKPNRTKQRRIYGAGKGFPLLNNHNDYNTQGRFPANLLICDDMLNDGVISKSGFNPKAAIKQYRGGNFGGGKTNDNGIDYGDKGTNSRYYDIDKWFNKIIE